MHVVALRDYVSKNSVYRLGRMYDIPDGAADILIRRKLVIEVPQKASHQVPIVQNTEIVQLKRRGRPRKTIDG